MECEICNQKYEQAKMVVPKVIKSCPHSYCQACLLKIKETEGKACCPICVAESSRIVDPEDMPNNEQLIKAMEYNEAQKKAMEIL